MDTELRINHIVTIYHPTKLNYSEFDIKKDLEVEFDRSVKK